MPTTIAASRQTVVSRVELRNNELSKQLADLERLHTDVSDQYNGNASILKRLEAEYPHIYRTIVIKTPPPHIEGRVVGVQDNVVVLSVGQDDKVLAGFEFTVSRGDQFVGTVKVTRVTADLAGCEIVFTDGGALIQVGDDVETKKF